MSVGAESRTEGAAARGIRQASGWAVASAFVTPPVGDRCETSRSEEGTFNLAHRPTDLIPNFTLSRQSQCISCTWREVLASTEFYHVVVPHGRV